MRVCGRDRARFAAGVRQLIGVTNFSRAYQSSHLSGRRCVLWGWGGGSAERGYRGVGFRRRGTQDRWWVFVEAITRWPVGRTEWPFRPCHRREANEWEVHRGLSSPRPPSFSASPRPDKSTLAQERPTRAWTERAFAMLVRVSVCGVSDVPYAIGLRERRRPGPDSEQVFLIRTEARRLGPLHEFSSGMGGALVAERIGQFATCRRSGRLPQAWGYHDRAIGGGSGGASGVHLAAGRHDEAGDLGRSC